MLQFIGNLIGVKADKAVQAGIEALVRWDPKSASEAELRSMEQHLDDLGQQVAVARQAFDREQKEADAIEALSRQRMAAAELLQRQMDARPTRRARPSLRRASPPWSACWSRWRPTPSARRPRRRTRKTS